MYIMEVKTSKKMHVFIGKSVRDIVISGNSVYCMGKVAYLSDIKNVRGRIKCLD